MHIVYTYADSTVYPTIPDAIPQAHSLLKQNRSNVCSVKELVDIRGATAQHDFL